MPTRGEIGVTTPHNVRDVNRLLVKKKEKRKKKKADKPLTAARVEKP